MQNSTTVETNTTSTSTSDNTTTSEVAEIADTNQTSTTENTTTTEVVAEILDTNNTTAAVNTSAIFNTTPAECGSLDNIETCQFSFECLSGCCIKSVYVCFTPTDFSTQCMDTVTCPTDTTALETNTTDSTSSAEQESSSDSENEGKKPMSGGIIAVIVLAVVAPFLIGFLCLAVIASAIGGGAYAILKPKTPAVTVNVFADAEDKESQNPVQVRPKGMKDEWAAGEKTNPEMTEWGGDVGNTTF